MVGAARMQRDSTSTASTIRWQRANAAWDRRPLEADGVPPEFVGGEESCGCAAWRGVRALAPATSSSASASIGMVSTEDFDVGARVA